MKLLKSKIHYKYGEALYNLGDKTSPKEDDIRFILLQKELDNMEVDLNELKKNNRLLTVDEWKIFFPNYTIRKQS